MDKCEYTKKIRSFYNSVKNVWPDDNVWHVYTHKYIDNYVSKRLKIDKENPAVLNAGSGGSTYGLKTEMRHLDIADNKIKGFKYYKVGSVEKIPYSDRSFDACICVGTVINYNDAERVIKELSRVLKKGGELILEFENSRNPEFKNYPEISEGKKFVTSEYFGEKHSYWVYSEETIKKLLVKYGFKISNTEYFHILSAIVYNRISNEDFSAFFAKFDSLCMPVKRLRNHCANIILTCSKGD